MSEDESRGAKSVGVGVLNESDRVDGERSERESEYWGWREIVRCQLDKQIREEVGWIARLEESWYGGSPARQRRVPRWSSSTLYEPRIKNGS